MKKIIIKFVDWFIRNYHADDYIHMSSIRAEIIRRIENAVVRTNIERDTELDEILKAERTKHRIECDGYLAEMAGMEKAVANAKKMRTDAETLYYRVVERARVLTLIAAENKHERAEIINDLGSSMGRLDKLVRDAEEVTSEIEKSKIKDTKLLRFK